jgi:hypothetical protein
MGEQIEHEHSLLYPLVCHIDKSVVVGPERADQSLSEL